jgi:hypothetical protein
MPANVGETDVLNYLVKIGPIPLADLALRFDDLPTVLRTLNDLRKRGDVTIVDAGLKENQGQVLERIIDRISEFPPDARAQQSYSVLMSSPEANSTVLLTNQGFKKAV